MTQPSEQQAPFSQRPPERPKEIDTAVQCWVAALVLSVVGTVVRTLTLPESQIAPIRRQAQRDGIGAATFDQALVLGQVLLLVVYVGLCVLWGLFIVKMRQGRPWARTVLSVLGWVTLAVIVLPLVVAGPVYSTVFYLVVAVAQVAAILLMFRQPANDFFGTRRNGA